MERDDNRFASDAVVSFAIYCDMNGLTREEGRDLAMVVADAMEMAADDRVDAQETSDAD